MFWIPGRELSVPEPFMIRRGVQQEDAMRGFDFSSNAEWMVAVLLVVAVVAASAASFV